MDNGWSKSAQAWIATVEEDKSRTSLLDSRVLALIGDPAGSRILDVGCGEGRLCRALARQGAHCTGIDPTSQFIERAKEVGAPEGPPIEYRLQAAEELEDVEAFDRVVFYLTLIDIPDFREAILRGARALKPGGKMVAANLNGFATCFPNPWATGPDGARTHMMVDQYMVPRGARVGWKGIEIINWHRPLSHYFHAYLEAGLTLRLFDEAVPTEEELEREPGLAAHFRAPYFNLMLWEKGSG